MNQYRISIPEYGFIIYRHNKLCNNTFVGEGLIGAGSNEVTCIGNYIASKNGI